MKKLYAFEAARIGMFLRRLILDMTKGRHPIVQVGYQFAGFATATAIGHSIDHYIDELEEYFDVWEEVDNSDPEKEYVVEF